MAWKESGGGADDPSINHGEGETLLEAEDSRVVSPEDVTDSAAHANPSLEEQPLIGATSSNKPTKLKLNATPKSSRKECSIAPIHSSTAAASVMSSNSPKTSSSRNSKVPIVINLDPSDRVSLNTGKNWKFVLEIISVLMIHPKNPEKNDDIDNEILLVYSKVDDNEGNEWVMLS